MTVVFDISPRFTMEGEVMTRAMRADSFMGYEGLRLV
jgi:hypothetical protein